MSIYYWIVILGVVVAAFSQILLKKGAMRPHKSFIGDYLQAPVIIGYIMMAASVVCSMIAYRGVDYMTVPVLEAIGFILVPILSYFFFGEKFTKNKVLGIALIFAGIAVYYML